MTVALKKRNIGSFPIVENTFNYNDDRIRKMYDEQNWSINLHPNLRLFNHHTLSSARRKHKISCKFEPKDRLDLALTTHYYNSGKHSFIDVDKFYTQPETDGLITWRVFRNNIPAPIKIHYQFNHPLKITKDNERNKYYKINLDARSEHSVLTGPNFHRRSDGGFYRV